MGALDDDGFSYFPNLGLQLSEFLESGECNLVLQLVDLILQISLLLLQIKQNPLDILQFVVQTEPNHVLAYQVLNLNGLLWHIHEVPSVQVVNSLLGEAVHLRGFDDFGVDALEVGLSILNLVVDRPQLLQQLGLLDSFILSLGLQRVQVALLAGRRIFVVCQESLGLVSHVDAASLENRRAVMLLLEHVLLKGAELVFGGTQA